MRSFIISLVILCSIILSVISVAVYSSKALSELEDAVEKSEATTLSDTVSSDEIEEKYRKLRPFLSLFVCDSEAREMEMYISDIKSAAKEGEEEALLTAKNRLRLHIDQLRRLSAFSIEAIF